MQFESSWCQLLQIAVGSALNRLRDWTIRLCRVPELELQTAASSFEVLASAYWLAFNRHRHSVPSTQTKRCDPPVNVTSDHLVHERHQHACSAGADGMADGDSAAVYVDFLGVQSELAH